MNIWFIAILLLAFALILGPIAMLRPKPAQQRKETLRMHAAKQGVRFGLRKPPQLKTALEAPDALPVYYLTPSTRMQSMSTWTLMRTEYEHEGNFFHAWDWDGAERPAVEVMDILRRYLADLPASVTVISQGKAGTCVHWSEREGTEVLDRLISMLKELHFQVEPDTP